MQVAGTGPTLHNTLSALISMQVAGTDPTLHSIHGA